MEFYGIVMELYGTVTWTLFCLALILMGDEFHRRLFNGQLTSQLTSQLLPALLLQSNQFFFGISNQITQRAPLLRPFIKTLQSKANPIKLKCRRPLPHCEQSAIHGQIEIQLGRSKITPPPTTPPTTTTTTTAVEFNQQL